MRKVIGSEVHEPARATSLGDSQNPFSTRSPFFVSPRHTTLANARMHQAKDRGDYNAEERMYIIMRTYIGTYIMSVRDASSLLEGGGARRNIPHCLHIRRSTSSPQSQISWNDGRF